MTIPGFPPAVAPTISTAAPAAPAAPDPNAWYTAGMGASGAPPAIPGAPAAPGGAPAAAPYPGAPAPAPAAPPANPATAAAPPVAAYPAVPAAPPAPAAYAPPAPAPAAPPAAVPGSLGAAIAGAAPQGAPKLVDGAYLLRIADVKINTAPYGHPNAGRQTLVATFEVLQSSVAAFPPGSQGAYLEGLQYGLSRIQSFVIAGYGYASKAALDQACGQHGQDPTAALTAMCDAAMAQTGSSLVGRVVSCVVTTQTRIPTQGKNAGKETSYAQFAFAPAAA